MLTKESKKFEIGRTFTGVAQFLCDFNFILIHWETAQH